VFQLKDTGVEMFTFLMIIHIIIAVALVAVILAQSSKGGGLDGMLGGAASNMLGGENASKFLKNTTKVLAVIFMLSCLLLTLQTKNIGRVQTSGKGVEIYKKQQQQEATEQQKMPAQPAPTEETQE
jgi:preprotein translocase subunit SecG